MKLSIPARQPSQRRPAQRASFARFHGRLMAYALLITLGFCALGPLVTAWMVAAQFKNGFAGRYFAQQLQKAAAQSELLPGQALRREELGLQLEFWRSNLFVEGTIDRDPDFTAGVRIWRKIDLLAVGPRGQVWAATTPQTSLSHPEMQLISRAQSGADAQTLWRREANWLFVAAKVPARNPAAKPLFLLLRVDAPLDFQSLNRAAWQYMWLDLDQTAVLALLIGSIASFLAAKPLLRRLKVISHAASDWSNGHLSHRVGGNRRGELGALCLQLDDMAAQLETLIAQRQSVAATQERERLMGELHDSVKQRMFALSMQQATAARYLNESQSLQSQNLQSQSLQSVAASLQVACDLAAQIQRDLHRIISPPQNLEAGHIDGVAIAEELEQMAALWRREGFEVRITTHLTAAISLEAWQELRAIAAESLANAARHSDARCVRISLQTLPDGRLRLEIADDGDGFSTSQRGEGRGLASMRNRAEKLTSGAFRLESEAGRGCLVAVECQNL